MIFIKSYRTVGISINFTANRLFCSKEIMKYLNVAEKNDAAKNIAGILSRGGSSRREGLSKYNKIYEWYGQVNGQDTKMTMTSVSGHLLNYEFTSASRSWHSCDPIDLFDSQVTKICPKSYENIKKTLEREVKYCQGLIVWTDCDREGENIGFEVIAVCNAIRANLRVFRAVFSEITAASIYRALQNLQQPNKNVSDAVDVRQEIDLRTGAAFTRLQTLRLQRSFPQNLAEKLISYGSCQFPTLGFVVDRYKEIENFIPEQFWKIKMSHMKSPLTTDFLWERERLFDRSACAAILDTCQESNMADVIAVNARPKSKWRPTPLDTIELEKTASRKLRINAKEVMKIAEKLYTQGFISYPRTETDIFPKELQLRPLIEMQQDDPRWGNFAQRILTVYDGPNARQGRKTDHAHPPIHPIKYNNHFQGNEAKVYEFIVRRFLACVSKDAEGHETSVKVNLARETFSAKGLQVLERHYLDVYIYDTWGDKAIGIYTLGEQFTPSKLEMTEGGTSAPNLLTEADLITLMDRHGIGTDATQADHIETIKQREYVALKDNGRHFVPGTLGMGLIEGYNEIGLQVSLAKPQLRAEFERELKAICDGRKRADDVRREQIAVYRQVFQQVAQRIQKLDDMVGSRLGVGGAANHGPGRGGNGPPGPGPGHRGGTDGHDDDDDQPPPPPHRPIINLPPSNHSSQPQNSIKKQCISSSSADLKRKNSAKNKSLPSQNNREFSSAAVININSKLEENALKSLDASRKSNIDSTCLGVTTSHCTKTIKHNASTFKTNQRSNGTIPNHINTTNKSKPSTSTTANLNTQEKSIVKLVHAKPIDKFDDLGNRLEFLPPLPQDFQCTTDKPGQVAFFLHDQEIVVRARTVHDDQIVCDCAQPAQLLTVRKEGPNQSRPFFRCAGNQCNMFLWESGDIDGASNNPIPVVAPSGQVELIDKEESQEIRCNCHQEAALRTVSKTGANTGRQFYGCPKPMGQGCKFFQWADELETRSGSSKVRRGGFRGGGRRGRGAKKMAATKTKRAASKCSNCHQEGHTRKTCKS